MVKWYITEQKTKSDALGTKTGYMSYALTLQLRIGRVIRGKGSQSCERESSLRAS